MYHPQRTHSKGRGPPADENVTDNFDWDKIISSPPDDEGTASPAPPSSRKPLYEQLTRPVPPPQRRPAPVVLPTPTTPPAQHPPQQRAGAPRRRSSDVEFVNLENLDPDILSLIPPKVAVRHRIVPYRRAGEGAVQVAFSDPDNLPAQDAARFALGSYDLIVVQASDNDIDEVLRRLERFGALSDIGSEARDAIVANPLASSNEDVEIQLGEGRIGKLLTETFRQAVIDGASDVHFEWDSRGLNIRVRIDGVLHRIIDKPHPREVGTQVVARLKVLAGLDIGERRVPQSGRTQIEVNNKQIDMRVEVAPTTWGEESAVVRLLDAARSITPLDQLGFSPVALKQWESLWASGTGVVLVTGPTGSGKTSTLYATMNRVAKPDVKVLTAEDPVEYKFEGIQQLQINHKAGLTFPVALRSFLRQDPDIVLVGEVRDSDTADIMVEAALTGHLVFSTVHTNSAAATPTRIADMGVEPYLLADALRGVVAQRLVRRLCDSCKIEYQPDDEDLESVAWPISIPHPDHIYKERPRGCPDCSRTGFRERIAVAEIMVVNEVIRDAIAQRKSAEVIAALAVENGMVTMRHDGFGKVADGLTSLTEVVRVLGSK